MEIPNSNNLLRIPPYPFNPVNIRMIYNRRYYRPTEAIVKQERWRRKQVNTLYEKGRPLFGKYTDDYRPPC